MAQAWGWWIGTSNSYSNLQHDHFVNPECCNRQSARPLPDNPRALGLPGGANWMWCSACTYWYPNLRYNCATGWVMSERKLCSPILFCVVSRGEHADSISGAQTPMREGRRYVRQQEILPPQPEVMIDDVGKESDDDAETRCLNLSGFLSTKTGFKMYESKPEMRIGRQQQYIEVNWNLALISLLITRKCCSWLQCGLALRWPSHWESSHYELLGQ